MLIFKWLFISHTLAQNPITMVCSIDSGCAGSPNFLNTNPFSFCAGNFYQKYLSLLISIDNSFDVKSRTNSSLQVHICDFYTGLPAVILRFHCQDVWETLTCNKCIIFAFLLFNYYFNFMFVDIQYIFLN